MWSAQPYMLTFSSQVWDLVFMTPNPIISIITNSGIPSMKKWRNTVLCYDIVTAFEEEMLRFIRVWWNGNQFDNCCIEVKIVNFVPNSWLNELSNLDDIRSNATWRIIIYFLSTDNRTYFRTDTYVHTETWKHQHGNIEWIEWGENWKPAGDQKFQNWGRVENFLVNSKIFDHHYISRNLP